MKRNMRFLLLFAILTSSILAAYFISGCGDDTTTITDTDEVVNDTVIGTVQGTVSDAWDNTRLEGVKVYWSHAGVQDSATTDANGYWSTDSTLSTGNYRFTFVLTGYASAEGDTLIHSLDWHLNDQNNPGGEILEEVTLAMKMWPNTGLLSGNVFTALPTGVSARDLEDGMALDDPNYATAAGGVPVTLDLSDFNVIGNKFFDTTDANGNFQFTNVPACQNGGNDWVVLTTSSFTQNGRNYEGLYLSGDSALNYADGSNATFPINIGLAASGGTTLPNIYAPRAGQQPYPFSNVARVIDYGWEGTQIKVQDTLMVEFSHAMDSSKTTITFGETGGSSVPFTFWWSADYMTLYIDPVPVLDTDSDYKLTITAWSQDGRELIDIDGFAPFERNNIATETGLDLVTTNLGSAGTFSATRSYIDFALDSPIVLYFNMPVNGSHAGNSITFTVGGTPVDYDTTFAGDSVVIDPDYPLVSDQTYSLDFKFYSSIEGDSYQPAGAYSVKTLSTAQTPAVPTGFSYDTTAMTWPVDYNTTAFKLEWTVPSGVENMPDSYFVYADADYTPLGREIVGRFAASQVGDKQDETVTLPAQFDVYDNEVGQTPFAADKKVSFWVRAWNSAGMSGYSDSLTFEDEQAPADFIRYNVVGSDTLAYQLGSADNTNGATQDTIMVFLGDNGSQKLEYVSNTAPTITFSEGGGDPAYVPSSYTWNGWDNDLQYSDTMEIYVDAGKVGAGDWLYVTISDNSGNSGTDSVRLLPYVEFYAPSDTSSTVFKAPSYDVAWTWHEPQDAAAGDIDQLDLYISYDGSTWHDTLIDGTSLANWADDADGGSKTLAGLTDTVRSTSALLGLMDADSGWIWPTPTFTYAGLKMTISAADSTALVHTDSSWYDRLVTDSSAIPVSFSSVGLDTVVIAFSDDAWGTTEPELDTVVIADPTTITTTDVTDYYPYNNSADYNCYLAVKDLDAGQPVNPLTWSFPVTNDVFQLQSPAAGQALPANGNFNVTWYNLSAGGGTTDTLPSTVTLQYAIVDDTAGGGGAPTDTTWQTIEANVTNKGWYAWSGVPNNSPSDSVILRGLTSADVGLDTTDQFSFQGIRFKQPTSSDTLTTYDSYNVQFYQYGGFSTAYDIEYSTDGGSSWTDIESDKANGGGDPETYAWAPDAAAASAQLRITSTGTDSTQAVSDAFTIRGFEITNPTSSDTFFIGRPDTIEWTTVGNFTNVEIEMGSVGGGWTEVVTANSNNNDIFIWSAVAGGHAAVTDAYVEVKDQIGGTALDSVTGMVYMQPEIEVTYPNGGETIQMSFPDSVTFNVYGSRTGEVNVYLSIDGGTSYPDSLKQTITAFSHGDDTTPKYTWNVPFISGGPYANCRIKVVETWTGQGTAMDDESDANFTLQQ